MAKKTTTNKQESVSKKETDSIASTDKGVTLLGAITYTNESDYENFLKNLTIEQSVVILIAAANFAQTKGIYSLPESELIMKSIKRLRGQYDNDNQAIEDNI